MIAIVLGAMVAAAQCPDGSPPPCRGPARAPAATNTIAVLYFDNLSTDTGDVYLADGFSEELMSRLSQVERIQVKSRTAVRRLRGADIGDPAQVGRSLAVAHLVTGSVRRARERVRITVELTRVSSGNTLWSRSFERGISDLMGAEAEVAESVAVAVAGRLAPGERRVMGSRPTRNPQAYDLLLRGRYAAGRRTTSSLLSAIRYLENAVRLDDDFTEAWIWLGAAYNQLGGLYYGPEVGMARESLMARGSAALDRAQARDSLSPVLWVARAAGSNARAIRERLIQAAARAPRDAEVQHTLALSLRILGQDSAAEAAWHRAIALEPDLSIALQNLGMHLYMRGRYREAMRWLDSAVAQRPEAAFFYTSRAWVQLRLGDTAAARQSAALIAGHGNTNSRDEILAALDARRGDTAAARARLLRVDSAMARRDCVVSHDCLELSMTLAMVGLRERALAVLERITPRDGWIYYWSQRPEFDAIRNEPRFRQVIADAAPR